MNRISYKTLLAKYIAHVVECEGTSYLTDRYSRKVQVHFSQVEIHALLVADQASDKILRRNDNGQD